MPCYHLDSRFPRGKRLCKCLVCIETLTLCFVTGNCRRSLLVIRSVRRSGMYSQSRLPRLSPTGCSLSERVFVTSSRLRVFIMIHHFSPFVKMRQKTFTKTRKEPPHFSRRLNFVRYGFAVIFRSSADRCSARKSSSPPLRGQAPTRALRTRA